MEETIKAKSISVSNYEGEDEMVPVEEWDGSCWHTMFDTLHEMAPDADPWDLLANLIKALFINKKDEECIFNKNEVNENIKEENK